jgi:hypothetical protein
VFGRNAVKWDNVCSAEWVECFLWFLCVVATSLFLFVLAGQASFVNRLICLLWCSRFRYASIAIDKKEVKIFVQIKLHNAPRQSRRPTGFWYARLASSRSRGSQFGRPAHRFCKVLVKTPCRQTNNCVQDDRKSVAVDSAIR